MNEPAPLLIERILTQDGASVAVKRRPNPGGRPVIFIHGISSNADLWDLPDVRGADFEYRSLATLLFERGWDVWLMNLRGHGAPHMLSEPAPGQTDWFVDHFILFDLPAVHEHVLRVTGQKPAIVGSSMGAMTMAGYLQGARLQHTESGERIVADPNLALERATKVATTIYVALPAALRWPNSLYDNRGQLRWDMLGRSLLEPSAASNPSFEILARMGWLESMISSAGVLPIDRLRPSERSRKMLALMPDPVQQFFRGAEHRVVSATLQIAGLFTGTSQHRAEVIIAGRRHVVDSVKSGVLSQMARCVREGRLVSMIGDPPLVYSEHYCNITAPAMLVIGGRDRIANPQVAQETFFERLGTVDRQLLLIEDFGHGEFEAAPAATLRVYPQMIKWLERDGGCPATAAGPQNPH